MELKIWNKINTTENKRAQRIFILNNKPMNQINMELDVD